MTIGVRRWLRGPARSGPDDAVVVDADRDRLRVAEAVRRRVAAGAGVVVVQAGDRVEPEQPADVRRAAGRAAGRAALVSVDSIRPVNPSSCSRSRVARRLGPHDQTAPAAQLAAARQTRGSHSSDPGTVSSKPDHSCGSRQRPLPPPSEACEIYSDRRLRHRPHESDHPASSAPKADRNGGQQDQSRSRSDLRVLRTSQLKTEKSVVSSATKPLCRFARTVSGNRERRRSSSPRTHPDGQPCSRPGTRCCN